jgi:membrane protease YdiL (CAAX protease family)
MHFALFITAMAWSAAANSVADSAAQGIAGRFGLGASQPLLESLFLVFLVVVGLRMLDWIATRGRFREETLPLPRRSGWQREWGIGAAIGWGLCLAAALPAFFTLNLHATVTWQRGTIRAVVIGLGTLLFASLAEELIFRGYAFRRLIAAIGPTLASVLLSVLFAFVLLRANPPRNGLIALIDCTLFGLLLAMAWLRTHGLWLGWGLHFAYRAVAAVILGLPVVGRTDFGSPTDMYASGARWLSGGLFGLDAALLTAFVMLGGMAVLYRETRDYAWNYTHPPIVPGGYEVVVPPLAAHIAMEQAAAPPPLVQIMPTTPQSRSTVEAPDR